MPTYLDAEVDTV